MKKTLLFISFFLCSIQLFYSQENGVVSFALPIRNSLKFNRYLINPAFSFVREQGSYISFYNKRQWTEFDNAPQTYLFGYSGRFKENEGIAIGLFQQNYGVLTTFGVVTNFAHNVVLDTDSNLTFGLNLGLYKSGLNNGKVITNYSDPSLNNIPSNLLASINPGINYGTAFLDFGLSVNNLILYNLKTSELIKENPERSIELHMMHTGYLDTYGFLDKSKFSALLKTELKKDKTVISGLMMFNVPNGIWAQAGYNTLYGMSAGLGLNITPRISIEYNFEKATGNLSNFGASHEITLAYKFKRDNYYNDDDDNEGALITPKVTKKYVASKPKTNENTKTVTDNRAKLVADAKIKAEEKAKLAADAKAKIIENRAKLVAENNAKREAIVQNKPTTTTQNTTTNKIQDTKANAQVKLLANEREKTKLTAEEKTKKIADANAKLIADIQIKAEQKAKIVADNRAKVIADRAKLIADAKAKREAMVLARLSAKNKTNNQVDNTKLVSNTDAKTKADAAAQAKLLADAKLKAETDAKAKIDAAARAILLAEAKLKTETDAKAKADAAAQAKLLTDAKLKTETDAKAKADAAAQAKLLAEAKLKPETDAKAKADAAAQAKLLADAKLKAETDAKAKTDAAAQAKLLADAKLKAETDAKVKADAATQAKLLADAKLKAETDAKAKTDASAQAKLLADAKLKAETDAKVKADAATQAKLLADAKLKADADAAAQEKLAITPNDELAKSMENLINLIKEFKIKQLELLKKLNGTVSNKEKDLKDLKEENDLSEKGIFTQPKPFKSVSAENNALFSLNSEIDQLIKTQKDKITELENLYKERLKKAHNKTDEIAQYYLKSIESLKVDQTKVIQTNTQLLTSLEEIKTATEIEKKRRIKKASFENDETRYLKDVETLKRLKETTAIAKNNFTPEDFDFGDEQSNMQILKNIKNTNTGYYLTIAVHNDLSKRDEFLKKTIATGQKNIDFFYDVNTSRYFIYYTKYNTIEEAKKALEAKGSTPYNGKMVIVKVEN